MKINSIGYDFKHGADFKLTRSHGLNEYLILIIRSKAVFHINNQSFDIPPSSMIIIDKNTPHSIYAASDLYINDWISFDLPEQEQHKFFDESIVLNTFFTSAELLICSEMIKIMQTENTSLSVFKNSNITYLFQFILNKFRMISGTNTLNKPYYTELKVLRDFIYNNPSKKYTVQALADKINLSKSYFQHCYKLYFNTTPIADVINSRIEYSKNLLSSTDFSISKISEIIGYSNDIQFIKQFKSIVGITPGKFRKSLTSL